MRLAFLAALWPALAVGGAGGTGAARAEDSDVLRSLLQVHVSVAPGHAAQEAVSGQQVQGGREGDAGAVFPSLPPVAVQDCDYLHDSAGPGPCSTTAAPTTAAPPANVVTVAQAARRSAEQGGVVPALPPPARHAADYVRDSTPGRAPTAPPSAPVAEGSDADLLRDDVGLRRLIPMAVVDHAKRSLQAARAGLRRAELDAQAALLRCARLREAREAERRHVLATGAGAEGEHRLAEAATKQEQLLNGTLQRAMGLRRVVSQAIAGLNDTRSQTFRITWESAASEQTTVADGADLENATALSATMLNSSETRTINITWDDIMPLRDQLEVHLESLQSLAVEADALEEGARSALRAAAEEGARAKGALVALEERLRRHEEQEANLTAAYETAKREAEANLTAAYETAKREAEAIDVPAAARRGFEAVNASLLALYRAPASTTRAPRGNETSSRLARIFNPGPPSSSGESGRTISVWGLASLVVGVASVVLCLFLCIM